MLKEREQDIKVNEVSIENLQNALDEQQETHEWNISQLEKEKSYAESNAKSLEVQVSELSEKANHKVVDTTKVDELQKQNDVLTSDLDQLIMQKETLSKELESVKDTLKTQELSKGNLVSKLYHNLSQRFFKYRLTVE